MCLCALQEGGWGLHNILNDAEWKLKGIVNGIDYKEWSPTNDHFLQDDGYMNYTMDNMVEGKRACKVGAKWHCSACTVMVDAMLDDALLLL